MAGGAGPVRPIMPEQGQQDDQPSWFATLIHNPIGGLENFTQQHLGIGPEQDPNQPTAGDAALGGVAWAYNQINRAGTSALIAANPDSKDFRDLGAAWRDSAQTNVGQAFMTLPFNSLQFGHGITKSGALAVGQDSQHIYGKVPTGPFGGADPTDPVTRALAQDDFAFNATTAGTNFLYSYFADPLVIGGKVAKPYIALARGRQVATPERLIQESDRLSALGEKIKAGVPASELSGQEQGWYHLYENRHNEAYLLTWFGGRHSGIYKHEALAQALSGTRDFNEFATVYAAARGDVVANNLLAAQAPSIRDALDRANILRDSAVEARKTVPQFIKVKGVKGPQPNPEYIPEWAAAQPDLAEATRIANDAASRSDWLNRMMGDFNSDSPKLFGALRENQLVSPLRVVNEARATKAQAELGSWAGKHWMDQVVAPIGGSGRVIHIMGWAGRDAPPGIIPTAGAAAEGSWQGVRDVLKSARMPDDMVGKWVLDYVNAATPNARQGVLVRMEEAVSRKMFADRLGPDATEVEKATLNEHVGAFFKEFQTERDKAMSDYRQHGWQHDVDTGRSTKLAPYEDLEAQNVPIMDFQVLRQALDEFDQHGFKSALLTSRDVSMSAISAFSTVWKAAVLLRVGAVPRNIGESMLASWLYTGRILQGDPVIGTSYAVGNLWRRWANLSRMDTADKITHMTPRQVRGLVEDRLGILLRNQANKRKQLTGEIADARLDPQMYYGTAFEHGSFVRPGDVMRAALDDAPEGVRPLLNEGERTNYAKLSAALSQRALRRGERENLRVLHRKATERYLQREHKDMHYVVERGGSGQRVRARDLTESDVLAPSAGTIPRNLGDSTIAVVHPYKQALAHNPTARGEAMIQPGTLEPDWFTLRGQAADSAQQLREAIARDDALIEETRQHLLDLDAAHGGAVPLKAMGREPITYPGSRRTDPRLLHPHLNEYISGGIGHVGDDRSVVGYVDTKVLAKMPYNEVSPERVAHYRERLRNGQGFDDPVMVEWDPATKKATVSEGNHRVQAALDEGVTHVPVRVVKGKAASAEWGYTRVGEDPEHGRRTLTFDPANLFERDGAGKEYWPPGMHPSYLFPPEHMLSGPIGVRTYTGAGPREGVAGKIAERVLSALGKNQMLLSTYEGQAAQARRFGRRMSIVHGSFKTFDPSDPMFYAASAEVANRGVRNSELAMRLLETDDPEAVTKWLLHTDDGRGILRRINLTKTYDDAVAEWVYRAHYNLFRAYPSEALRNDILKGEVTESQVRAYLGGRGDLVPTISREYLPSIRTTRASDGISRFVDAAFRTLWSLPEDKLARYPLYDSLYRAEHKRIVNDNMSHLEGMSQKDANEWIRSYADTGARSYAQHTVQRVVYSSERRNNVAEKLRFISPFLQVTGNRFYFYGSQALENPQNVARMFLGWNAIPSDDNGAVMVHLPGPVAKRFGLEDLPTLSFQKSAANLIQNGEPWWSPGVGPVVTVPVGELLRRNADSPIAQYMTKVLGSAGVFPQGYLGQSAWDQVLPTWGRRYLAGQGQQATNTQAMIMAVENWKYEQHLRDKPPTLQEVNERNDQLWAFRVLAAFVSPAQPLPQNDMVSHYTKVYQDYRKQFGKDADARFLSDHPEYYDIVLSYTTNPSGINPTQVASARETNNNYLLASLPSPEMGAMVTNLPNDVGKFDQSAYYWQMNRPLAPGSSQIIRGGAAAEDAINQRLVSRGWVEFRDISAKVKSLLLAAKQAGGSDDINAKSNLWIRLGYDDAQQKIVQDTLVARPDGSTFSPWGEDFAQQDAAKYGKRADSLRLILTPEYIRKNIKAQPWLTSAADYLALRDKVRGLLDNAKQHGGSGDINAQSNLWLKLGWDSARTALSDADPQWSEWASRYFVNDDLSMIPGSETV